MRSQHTTLGISKVKFSILELEWVYLVVGVIAAIVAAAENHVDILAEEGHTEARLEQTKLPVDHSLGHVGVAAGEGVADKFSERIHTAHSGAPVNFRGEGLKINVMFRTDLAVLVELLVLAELRCVSSFLSCLRQVAGASRIDEGRVKGEEGLSADACKAEVCGAAADGLELRRCGASPVPL